MEFDYRTWLSKSSFTSVMINKNCNGWDKNAYNETLNCGGIALQFISKN